MEKKRKLKEAYEQSVKRQKEDSDAYLDNFKTEREEARLAENLRQAQMVCQNLDHDAAEKKGVDLKKNVLWRGLDRKREKEHEERRARNKKLYERSAFDDEEYDTQEVKLEGEDEELDEFEGLPLEEQMDKVLTYMRETYYYCFW